MMHGVDGTDARIAAGLALFNRRDYAEASDVFEDLFFEAVRDELELMRVLLQMSVGIHHIERGQKRPAIERLAVGLLAIDRVVDDRGLDLGRLRADVAVLIDSLRHDRAVIWPRILLRVDDQLPVSESEEGG